MVHVSRWVESTFSNLLEDPSVQAVVINFRDITERKQAQDALAASLAELHALFASMQDTVLVIDRDGVYRKIAPTNSNKSYILPQDVIGKKLDDFFPAEQVKKFIKVIRQVLETKQTMQIEYKSM
ncbi:MAG: PAS domain-containing protein [Anaerolineales bacterium]|nr:PAS domain-containing protein [Anaerolineales bacterium]